ncbi:hypothetical protein HYY70_01640 [Candidatus Woesearchaeota archaeon]|nr:hypothetical protein [Candidatus Woesearchaeota archaeon]
MKSNFNPIALSGKFGSKTPSFFYANKGGDLVKNNLVLVKDKAVIPTEKGKEFIKELIDLKILEVD